MCLRNEGSRTRGSRLVAIALVLGLAATSGCLGTSSEWSRPRELRDANGFTITETVRPGLGARGDFDRALKALEAGDTARAIELLEAVTAAEPGLAPAFIDLGIAYARDGKLQQAETSLLRAVELNPRHPAAQNELGIVYRRMGRFAEARAAYEAALVLHPSFHHARRNLGILCDLYLADPGCALEQYELYLQAAPEDETVAMWVADLANRLGRSQE